MTTRTRALVIFLLSLVLGTGPAAATSGPTSPETVAGSSIALPVSVRLGDDIGKKLQGTPRPFHKAVRRELVQIWKDAGYEPACRRGGGVKGRVTRKDGSCSTLRRFNVPRMMGAKVCYDRNGDTVSYAPRS